MNHPISRRLLFVAAILDIFTLAGCDTLRPLSSKPPRDKLVLAAPFTTSWWDGILPPLKFTVILPPGEYRPLYEDDRYYYFQGPSKVVFRSALDVGSSLFDGGIYVARGTTHPRGWYFVNEDGSQSTGEFKVPPPTR